MINFIIDMIKIFYVADFCKNLLLLLEKLKLLYSLVAQTF